MPALRSLLSNDPIHRDLGLLVLRLGVGLSMLVLHGWGKITGGPELWARVGGAMGNLGLGFAPTMWGFAAAFAESAGAALLVLGLLFRPAAAVLAFTMFVAGLHHLSLPAGEPGAGWKAASHALELMAVCAALLLSGPGRFAIGGSARARGGEA